MAKSATETRACTKKAGQRLAPDPAAALWRAYHRRRSIRNRNALVEHYRHLAVQPACILCKQIPAGIVAYDDLLSVGVFGLVAAIGSFDPAQQVKFATFSRKHIRGTMLDLLRGLDFVPRATRTLQRKHNATIARIECDGRVATSGMIAQYCRIPKQEVERRRLAVDTIHNMLSLDAIAPPDWDECDDRAVASVLISDRRTPDPSAQTIADAWWETLLGDISKPSRVILQLLFRHHWRQDQIARHLGISSCWVSQLVRRAVEFLRQCKNRDDFADRPDRDTPGSIRPLLVLCHQYRHSRRKAALCR
jgi:RNA polymerase sigma factor for flagellar operon FliA